ncbi:unnamed protein product [Penicillium nalgiovense]|uniref:Uncharacterized protein n=1 Tax=Penicillium nalgiovense TaxID=60175 RepID=A0A9W4MQA0_PENNA|nr:unnamed protein product [Penicillium nalgiovense]CAG7977346.1 unnamed protein product [Penicillium nalgiovense]CAG7977505.1 unnamed protein product [Penicillium nalgiovense]CAG7979209.1 unnamed protein product [Penicillium nalgiovense]CAG7983025.1 unnamed protein product [Penicillium nalgiovense]
MRSAHPPMDVRFHQASTTVDTMATTDPPTTIRPDAFPDFFTVGRRSGTRQDLAGREFLTHCPPPDLPPRHRILALLGITDKDDLASPSEDGWFVSDFYLFHYLLSPKSPRPPNQIWLTCEDPSALVRKYHEYIHGDPNGDRRAVLDGERLPDILEAGNVRVVPRKVLLERYLSTLREQVAEAARCEEHLVLLLFGHGTSAHGIEVGDSILRMKDLRHLLQPTSSTTIFTTSCYSGGWLVRPDINQQQLNTTAITASGEDNESSSWAISESAGRASGSLAASAVLRCLIDAEDETQERTEDPTYIEFSKSVYDCVKDIGSLGNSQRIYFSAENDEWETSYQPRLGLPLTSYNDKWLSLRHMPPSTSSPSSTRSPEPAKTGGRRLKRLKYLAEEYFAAKPGPNEAAPNIGLHNCLRSVLNGATYSEQKVDSLTETTAYRLGAMYEADYLREQIGLKVPSIFGMETPLAQIENQSRNPDLYTQTWRLLLKREICTTPIGIRLHFPKPLQYLTIALVESSTSWEMIQDQVEAMASKKKAWFRFIYKAWMGNRVARDEGVMKSRRAFLEACKKLRY